VTRGRAHEEQVVGASTPPATAPVASSTPPPIATGLGAGDDGARKVTRNPAECGILGVVSAPLASAPPASVVLLSSCGTHKLGTRFALTKSPVVVGRAADADVRLDHESVSPYHGRFVRQGEGWWVVAAAGSWGLRLNHDLIWYQRPVLLDGRELVHFGSMRLRFSRNPAEPSEFWRNDDLTALHTEPRLHEVLKWMCSIAVPVAVALVKVDLVGLVLKVCGSEPLHQLFQDLGALIREMCDLSDLASHEYGTFTILTPHGDRTAMARKCEQLHEAVRGRLAPACKGVALTLSIGIADSAEVAVSHEAVADELLGLATARCEAALQHGGDCIVA
jgi:GGDEF domain-containing protein